ncbi:MAG TPA: M23 family metallopeptidase [Solirubrobacterales bacterium]|jgi:murein DD-endopeptidase MepM/ murein hydrolase activator NlpD|nr:M23 family metallopeptidase [Solirubrobacterales bacterium]
MAKPSLLVLLVAILVATAAASSSVAADGFKLQEATATPPRALFDGETPIEVRFRFAGPEPADVAVAFLHEGTREVRRLERKRLEPGEEHVVTWNGLTDAGRAAPDGRYRVLVGPSHGQLGRAAEFALLGHIFPVRGPHGTRGPVGEFGAARNGGRVHQGFDVTAACGTRLVAARGGTVVRRRFDARLDGNFVVIAGRKEGRTYRYSHLLSASPLDRGERVRTGELVGRVGQTGNARSTPCHLHFELRQGKRFLDPKPYLLAWDRVR